MILTRFFAFKVLSVLYSEKLESSTERPIANLCSWHTVPAAVFILPPPGPWDAMVLPIVIRASSAEPLILRQPVNLTPMISVARNIQYYIQTPTRFKFSQPHLAL